MKRRAYPKYKPSGVEWLGDVPEHWEVVSLRFAFRNLDHRRIPVAGEDRAVIEKIYPYYGASGIIDFVDDYLFDETLILVAEDGANLLSRSTPLAFLATGEYWVNNHAHILKPIDGDIRYWAYLLQTFDYTPLVTGAAQPKLTSDRLAGIRLPSPHLPDQRTIAAFLDRETGRIDTLVAKKRELIERLKEKRTALISRTVTRGLPPEAAAKAGLPTNPPLKPSGLDWLGEIPEHWEVKRLRRMISMIEQGWSPECASAPASPDEWGVVRAGCCNGGRFNPEDNKQLPSDLEPPPHLEIRPGDLLMSRASGSEGLIGSVAVVPIGTRPQLLLSDKTYRLTSDGSQVSSGFLFYVLHGPLGREQIRVVISGALGLAKNIAQSDVKDFIIPTPPLREQDVIAKYLDTKTEKLDASVAKIEEAIERLQEYRTALITAAVTGKIDVRKATERGSTGAKGAVHA